MQVMLIAKSTSENQSTVNTQQEVFKLMIVGLQLMCYKK